MIDAHVHFWDPAVLEYPWLDTLPALQRAFTPVDYASATVGTAIERIVFVECNCRPAQNLEEAAYAERLAKVDPRVSALVAYVDLTAAAERERVLDVLSRLSLVKGIRHNIQGERPGFALQREFVAGVHAVGRAGFPFDLCVTHDQLADVIGLVAQCPDTCFVLDHCGKPAIRDGVLEPWRTQLGTLAGFDNVCCKLSGLFTEAAPGQYAAGHVGAYASHVIDAFGIDRVLYGSDWPVLTLAAQYHDWFDFTQRFTDGWSANDRQSFYHDNAARFYGL